MRRMRASPWSRPMRSCASGARNSISRFENDDVDVFRAHRFCEGQGSCSNGEWDVLVIDEAHRVVARQGLPASPITRNALKLAHASKHLLLLSATPVLHHDDDLLALLELLDPENYSIAKARRVQGTHRAPRRAWPRISGATQCHRAPRS